MTTQNVIAGDIVSFQRTVAAVINKNARLSVGSFKHYSAANALTFSTLSGTDAAAQTAANHAGNEVMVRYLAHVADTIAHIAAGVAPVLVPATSLATLVTLCEAIRTDYTAHIADAAMHPTTDSTNTIAAATVTNLATAQTFLNEMLNTTAYQAHAASAPVADSILVVNG